jgi:hypothetical protein
MSEEFRFGEWLSEGLSGVRQSLRLPHKRLLPEAFCEHMRSSRKEVLLAFRSLFDTAIEHLDKPPKSMPKQATKIKVE